MIQTNRARLYNSFMQGVGEDSIVAYHGTSLQVLRRIIETGEQPGAVEVPHQNVQAMVREGDIFMFPIKDRTDIVDDPLVQMEALEEAMDYAGINAFCHRVCERLGWSVFSDGHEPSPLGHELSLKYFAMDFLEGYNFRRIPKFIKFLLQRGYDFDQAARFVNRVADENQGVVLGYSKEVLNGTELIGHTSVDIRVQGVTIDHIVGVQALDKKSSLFLEGLAT
ncbi:hypothetical protein HOD38_03680 [archaeon]|jgi:hypothetical protein|nr:hypothetical protein [archaeon]MBT4397341.1 hypothetical protein [archaeon]MBT4440721.1 hypothetical protein [archaeon]